jgi:hypothetical protein
MLADYLEYSEMQESPKLYHTWIALSMIASCLERNVWIDRGFFKIFPNLYVMIMGDSAVYAKSTAILMGQDILYMLGDHRPTIFEGQITIPRLIMDLSAMKKDQVSGKLIPDSRVLILAPELSLFFRDENQAKEIIYFLTDFYTGKTKPWHKSTVAGANGKIIDPCINFIGGSTAEWLATGLSQSDFGGGFVGRCIFVVPTTKPRKVANPHITDAQKAARERFVGKLLHIRSLRGEYKLSADASAFYEEWYLNRPDISPNDRLISYHKRKAENILKLGLMNAIMSDHDEISVDDLQWALDTLLSLEPAMPQAFQFLGTEENVLAELIITHLRLHGGADMFVNVLNNIAPRLKSLNQFNSVLELLRKQEKVREVGNGSGSLLSFM